MIGVDNFLKLVWQGPVYISDLWDGAQRNEEFSLVESIALQLAIHQAKD